MKRFIFILVVLLQYSLSAYSICLTDNQICRKRSSLIYQLDKALLEIKETCGREPSLKVEWKSLESIIGGNDTYNADGCVKPIEFFVDFCAFNATEAKKILDSVETFECQGVGVDKQALAFKNSTVRFMMDPTNDWRSERKGPAVSSFVLQEMKSLFKIAAVNKQEADQLKREASKREQAVYEADMAEKRKQGERFREQQQKEREANIKSQVNETVSAAKKKVEVFQSELKKAATWMQEENSKIQKSNLSPEEKSKKISEVVKKYQADVERAQKAYSEGK